MKIDTFIKLGSLAFGVVQDEKVQELFKIAHNGAKRRGLFETPVLPQNPTQGSTPFYSRRPQRRTPFP